MRWTLLVACTVLVGCGGPPFRTAEVTQDDKQPVPGMLDPMTDDGMVAPDSGPLDDAATPVADTGAPPEPDSGVPMPDAGAPARPEAGVDAAPDVDSGGHPAGPYPNACGSTTCPAAQGVCTNAGAAGCTPAPGWCTGNLVGVTCTDPTPCTGGSGCVYAPWTLGDCEPAYAGRDASAGYGFCCPPAGVDGYICGT